MMMKLKNFNNIRKKKMNEFNKFRINSQKKIIETLNPIITSFFKKRINSNFTYKKKNNIWR